MLYMTAAELSKKSMTVQVAVLLHSLGEDALEIYNTFEIAKEEPEEVTVDKILEAFRNYCTPKKNVVFERHQFWTCVMHEPMQIDKFVTELRQKSKNCEFGTSEDDMIRDKIVFSVTDKSVTEKLLRKPNLTLQAIDICRASEIAKERINIMASAKKESEVHAFDMTKGAKYKNKPFKATPSHNKKEKVSGTSKACPRCGQTPAPRSCPACGAKCRACGKAIHFAKMCKMKSVQTLQAVDSLFMGTLQCTQINAICKNEESWYTTMTIRGIPIEFKLDTGDDANVLPLEQIRNLPGDVILKPTETMLVAYGGARIKPAGYAFLKCHKGQKESRLLFFVMEQSTPPILGRAACEQLNLIKRIDLVRATVPTTKDELVKQYP